VRFDTLLNKEYDDDDDDDDDDFTHLKRIRMR